MLRIIPRIPYPRISTLRSFSSKSSSLEALLNISFTDKLFFKEQPPYIPCFRLIDEHGERVSSEFKKAEPSKEMLLNLFEKMVTINTADTVLNQAQRQNQISFYMTGFGEEGSVLGSISGLKDQDWIFPQYREHAALLWRGWTLQDFTNQLVGNISDRGRGKQMPVHYGDKRINYVTVSSPLGTQIPQAAGAGYHFRVSGEKKIAVTYFGDGAASEGDFSTAINFASTLRSQTLFYCRNNFYAISTPVDEQYSGDGIAARSKAYGINSIKVDGNDVVAVHVAVKKARELILETQAPVLIEAHCYRVGDHSTSDFSQMYRTEEELKKWKDLLKKFRDPISRLQLFMQKEHGLKLHSKREEIVEKVKKEVRESLKKAKAQKLVPYESLVEDVYNEPSAQLEEQRASLISHAQKYRERYDLDKYGKY